MPWERASFGAVATEYCRTVPLHKSEHGATGGSVIESVVPKLQQCGSGRWKLGLVSAWLIGKSGAASSVLGGPGVGPGVQ